MDVSISCDTPEAKKKDMSNAGHVLWTHAKLAKPKSGQEKEREERTDDKRNWEHKSKWRKVGVTQRKRIVVEEK